MNDNSTTISVTRASLWALVAAVLALVLAVLPAEYGIDITGFGKLTGLTSFAGSKLATEATAPVVAEPTPVNAGETGGAPALATWAVAHPDVFTHRTYEVPLKGDEELEYKAVMSRGDTMAYRWHVKEGSQVYFEFHGEPTEGQWPQSYYESYEKGEASSGAGNMVAPFKGNHGWYWLNLSDKPVTVVVEMAGYYSDFARIGEAVQQ